MVTRARADASGAPLQLPGAPRGQPPRRLARAARAAHGVVGRSRSRAFPRSAWCWAGWRRASSAVSCAASLLVDGEDVARLAHAPARASRRRWASGGRPRSSRMVAETVYEEVAFGPANLGLPRAEVMARTGGARQARHRATWRAATRADSRAASSSSWPGRPAGHARASPRPRRAARPPRRARRGSCVLGGASRRRCGGTARARRPRASSDVVSALLQLRAGDGRWAHRGGRGLAAAVLADPATRALGIAEPAEARLASPAGGAPALDARLRRGRHVPGGRPLMDIELQGVSFAYPAGVRGPRWRRPRSSAAVSRSPSWAPTAAARRRWPGTSTACCVRRSGRVLLDGADIAARARGGPGAQRGAWASRTPTARSSRAASGRGRVRAAAAGLHRGAARARPWRRRSRRRAGRRRPTPPPRPRREPPQAPGHRLAAGHGDGPCSCSTSPRSGWMPPAWHASSRGIVAQRRRGPDRHRHQPRHALRGRDRSSASSCSSVAASCSTAARPRSSPRLLADPAARRAGAARRPRSSAPRLGLGSTPTESALLARSRTRPLPTSELRSHLTRPGRGRVR